MFCSIIVPVYNTEALIHKCVRSILAQTSPEWELILVDDGSTDASGSICDSFAETDSRIVVIHQTNQGHTAARTAGLEKATGQYVLYVDSDDWIDSELIEDCRNIALEYDPDVMLFGYRRVYSNKSVDKPQPRAEGYYPEERLRAEILSGFLTAERFSLSEHMVKRERMVKCQRGIRNDILLGEDLLCCAGFMTQSRSAYVLPGCYYNYLQRQSSISHSEKNYTFANWFTLENQLTERAGGLLPNYDAQLACCAVRFIHRAVIGAFARQGFHLATIRQIRQYLGRADIAEHLSKANRKGKRNYRVKLFLLRRKYIVPLYFIDRLSHICR